MLEVDKGGDGDGIVGIQEIEKALRKAERAGRPSRSKSVGSLFPSRQAERRASIAVCSGQQSPEDSPTPARQARSVTPSQTIKRRSVTGSPQDARRSLLQHMPEDKLIREPALL